MTKGDREKLTKAGFKILRLHDSPIAKITMFSQTESWSNYKLFDNKSLLNKEMKRINH